MRTSAIAAAATALALAACTLGTRPATFEPARSPQGIEARIGYWGPRHTVLALVGELLAVTDSGLVVLSADRRLVHAHWPVLVSATFRQIGVRLHGGDAPEPGYGVAAARVGQQQVCGHPEGEPCSGGSVHRRPSCQLSSAGLSLGSSSMCVRGR